MYQIIPKTIIKGQSFKHCKKVTVPNQNLSLQEILRRFVRRESLPIMKEGTYQTGFGDLEKLQNMDITEKMEHVEKIKSYVRKGQEMYEEREKKRAEGSQGPKPEDSPGPKPEEKQEPPTPPKA